MKYADTWILEERDNFEEKFSKAVELIKAKLNNIDLSNPENNEIIDFFKRFFDWEEVSLYWFVNNYNEILTIFNEESLSDKNSKNQTIVYYLAYIYKTIKSKIENKIIRSSIYKIFPNLKKEIL